MSEEKAFMGATVKESSKKVGDATMMVYTVDFKEANKLIEEKGGLSKEAFKKYNGFLNDVAEEAHKFLEPTVSKNGAPAELRIGKIAARMDPKKEYPIPGTDKKKSCTDH